MKVYILTDGMSESPEGITSLDLAEHPNLDKLTMYGQLGFYEPVIRKYVNNPETSFIFPYFFGLHPEDNPGRVALELFELGLDISKLQSFSIIRVVKKGYNIQKVLDNECVGSTWSNAPLLGKDLPLIQNIIDEVEKVIVSSKIVKSPRRDNVWSIGTSIKTDLEDAINIIQYKLDELGYAAYAMLLNDRVATSVEVKEQETTFLGWGFSTLIEAFRYAGLNILQTYGDIKNHLFDYNGKLKDLNDNILPFLKSRLLSEHQAVLFIKEPSRAAREFVSHEKKIESIVFIDNLIGSLLSELEGKDVDIIILSDHQSNIGSKRTYPGPTLWYKGNLAFQRYNKTVFSEKSLSLYPKILNQEELISLINSKTKSNEYWYWIISCIMR